MPWAYDGGSSWNATRCSPLADDPGAPGDPCTVVGSAVSGIDDCERGAMCWDVDPETNTGECIAFCEGVEENPTCTNPCDRCNLTSDGIVNLCLPTCDPLAQNCGHGEACYPIDDDFVCIVDASGDLGGVGDPCMFPNVCDPGLYCADASTLPGCESERCCAPFCDTAEADTCDALLPGTTCLPWFDRGRQAPGGCVGTTIGACVIPR